ncbi:YciI family protein [uncultured Jatrophihabitans sp.]|uniref:YciI family protein n=1 Tax=uncultured Jatrophihabitans sp. TaxID=1610747 RepID=UPI0035C9B027
MSRYLVAIQEDEQKWIDMAEGANEALENHYRFNIARADAVIAGRALQPSSTATSLRADDTGGAAVTDGPFVETKEVLGGFYLIEAADDAEALEIAREVPAPFGGLEIRPVQDFGGPTRPPKEQADGLSSYVVLLYVDEARSATMTPEERQDLLARHGAFQAGHDASVLIGDALQQRRT